MCTVTVLPGSALSQTAVKGLQLRVACNRDELLTRSAALPPVVRAIDSRRVVMPVDPDSGGTWIAANDAGLVATVLNAYEGPSSPIAPVSRGTIVPALMHAATAAEAMTAVRDLSAKQYRPFRLLVMDAREFLECSPYGGRIECRLTRLDGPVMRTSSGLGDALVSPPRSALFRQCMESTDDLKAAQDSFHVHQWPDRKEVSVLMQRAEARTVSRTIVEVGPGSVTLSYRPIGGSEDFVVKVAR